MTSQEHTKNERWAPVLGFEGYYDVDIPIIRKKWADGETITEIARRRGVGWATIADVVKGKTWTHV